MADSSYACGGACCRAFPLSETPEQLDLQYRVLKGKADKGHALHGWEQDIITIHDMIRPVETRWPNLEPDRQLYTCVNLDTTTGLCTIYERRPQMCRNFPGDGRACRHCGFHTGSQVPDLVPLLRRT